MAEFAIGNLVRWLNGQGDIGVVVQSPNPAQVVVQFDSGDQHIFPAGTDVLERVVFANGDHVALVADGSIGHVVDALPVNGRISYGLSMADGTTPRVLENSVRRAVIEHPVQRLRVGELDSTRSTNLRVAATRLAFAHQFDELSSLSNSRVEIKPHQVGVVHRVAGSYPHRFLLADEVGLGKTIEAGLIIKELKARGMADRVLILAPSGIVRQWQFEMKTKFNEVFAQYDRQVLRYLEGKYRGENPWTREQNVIVSTGFASMNDERMRAIALAGWDLVVIDEAHHARRTWQGENKQTSTRLFKLAELLNEPEFGGATSCLFLTATPMQLHPFELYALVDLLDPTLFASYEDFEGHRTSLAGLNYATEVVRNWDGLPPGEQKDALSDVSTWTSLGPGSLQPRLDDHEQRNELIDTLLARHRLSEVMIRNRKSVVGGFMPRVATIWEVELTQQERDAYDAVTEYVRTGYARAKRSQNQAFGFLMTTFQKLLCSSTQALMETMLKRIEKLEQEDLAATSAEPEEAAVEEADLRVALDGVLGATSTEKAIAAECRELEALVDLLDKIELDSKTRELLKQLDGIREREPDAKVIIFTHYLNTQRNLAAKIGQPWTVNLFHGGLKPAEKDGAVERFRDGTGPQLLISTEAGGEGRNFQFCHMMVNYDLPWNPMKVEQRIGRIDRIGQKQTVKVFNFSTVGTVEQRVVEVLHRRIGLFVETIGGLDPILGDVERDLNKIFAAADDEAERQLESFERKLEARVHEARKAERQRADFIMDTKSYRQDEVDALLERRGTTTNDDLRRFVLGALGELGCFIEEDRDLVGVYDVTLQNEFPEAFPQYYSEGAQRRVTFDPSVALDYETVEFLAFGHELVDGLVARARDKSYPARASRRRVFAPDISPTEGWFFTYTIELDGMVRAREVFPIFIDLEGEHDQELGRWLLERACRGKKEDYGDPRLPAERDSLEVAHQRAETLAVTRLAERQMGLAEANTERLEQERTKLERYYEYKARAAAEKLDRVRTTFEKVSASEEPEVQKIIPVWAKNLETAKRIAAEIESERERRLGGLVGREQVMAKYELLSASFVEVLPDPAELPLDGHPNVGPRLRPLAVPLTAEELAARVGDIKKRKVQLAGLAKQHKFGFEDACACADKLQALCARAAELDKGERALLAAATGYFLLVDDVEHDLKHPTGFADDLAVVHAVAETIGA